MVTELVDSPGSVAPLLSVSGIGKSFGRVHALRDISLEVHAGEVVGLLGVNGAGKSTLMNIVGGVFRPDRGIVQIRGQTLAMSSPREAQAAGVAFVHQELALFPDLDVATNLAMLTYARSHGFVRRSGEIRRAKDEVARVGLEHVDPRTPLQHLRPGERQLVEIARTLSQDCRLLILDEATSSLTQSEVDRLFGLVRRLTGERIGVIYLSHRLDEIFELCDRVVVLRDGVVSLDVAIAATNERDVVQAMLGPAAATAPSAPTAPPSTGGAPVLKVTGLSGRRLPVDLSLTVASGEIVGLAGLLGAGRSETVRCIFGLEERTSGTVEVAGRTVAGHGPAEAIDAGLALLTEDRAREGLLLERGVTANTVLAGLRDHAARSGFMRPKKERKSGARAAQTLGIVTPTLTQPVRRLSGGNQQKVVLGKWLARSPIVLMLDEPTRGIDVGAKQEVYSIVRDLAARGVGVLVISSEIPELVAICHRVLVMRDGRVVEELAGSDLNFSTILLASAKGPE